MLFADQSQSVCTVYVPASERHANGAHTHQSESLVRFIAAACALPDDLGRKDENGVLASMTARATFLTDPSHRIRFVYTSKHSFWLNQIEIWFSVLMRHLLKRATFLSTDDLRLRQLDFIAFFIQTARPFKWTYKRRPLQA